MKKKKKEKKNKMKLEDYRDLFVRTILFMYCFSGIDIYLKQQEKNAFKKKNRIVFNE